MGPIMPAPKWLDWIFPTLFVWVINGLISVFVLWKLLVSMEPVTDSRSKSSTQHRHFRMLAEEAIEEVSKIFLRFSCSCCSTHNAVDKCGHLPCI